MFRTLTNTRRANRRRKIVTPPTAVPIYILSAEAAGPSLAITFDQPVILNGTPAYTSGALHVVSAVQSDPDAVVLSFNGSMNDATQVVIPFQDPAIRNASGGYVTVTQLAIPF